MKPIMFLSLALVTAGALAVSLPSAVAHNWVPRYDGAKWGQQCLAPSQARRVPPTACCEHARFYCLAACDLTDINDGWKNACRANCQAAGSACLQRVQKRPPVGGLPGTTPPATTN
jgi:hypothetical protein